MRTPRVIFTAGCFDLLHAGHISLLWRSKELGDVLVVGVISDQGAFDYKGRYPLESLKQRVRNVKGLSCVDVAVFQGGTDPTANLERFRPAAMTHGSDWTKLREGHETLERLGIEWVLLPYTEGVSTSELRKNGQSLPQSMRLDPEIIERGHRQFAARKQELNAESERRMRWWMGVRSKLGV